MASLGLRPIHLQPPPTTCPERFQFFVGEPLGAPAGACRGHPHLSGLTASHLPPRRGKALRAADSRPYSGKRARSVGSAKPGAVHKPQQRHFLQTQGPVARNETIKATQILRAGNFLPDQRDNPRNGVRGKATMSTKCSSGAVPGGVLVTLPPRAKSLAARRRRNIPGQCLLLPQPSPYRNFFYRVSIFIFLRK